MRARAFRPEVPDCLEERSLLSGAAGQSADPVVLSNRRLIKVEQQMVLSFHLFSRDRYVPGLLDSLHDSAVMIPFGRVDGLGVTINRTVDRMHRDLAAGVPDAIRLAGHDVIAAVRAEVAARVRAGDVVVR